MASGIYLVTLLNETPISTNAHDARIARSCLRVNRLNCKLGKARNLDMRSRNYAKTFGGEHVVFRPIALMENVEAAERVVQRAVSAWRMRGNRRRLTEWLAGIAPEEAEKKALDAMVEARIAFSVPARG